MDLSRANKLIDETEDIINRDIVLEYSGELYTGVDLGTANIVLTVVDSDGNIVAASSYASTVIKDGVVVDYVGAIDIVRKLKRNLEDRLGVDLIKAATAIPPGINEGSIKSIVNVVEACDFEVIKVVDEPTAAAFVLNIENGIVVDVGGGTTGISVLKNNDVIYTADEPTGGHHMSLVVSGTYRLAYEDAEDLKKDSTRENEIFNVIKPVVEKMSFIVKKHLESNKLQGMDKIIVVGGACSFTKFEEVLEKIAGIKTYKTHNPLLVTPIGIALSCLNGVD